MIKKYSGKDKDNAINRMYLHAKGLKLSANVINKHAPHQIDLKFIMGQFSSEIVLLCLSSEILLKLILLHNTGQYNCDHRLIKLLKDLDAETQHEIYTCYKIYFTFFISPKKIVEMLEFHHEMKKQFNIPAKNQRRKGVDSVFEPFELIPDFESFLAEIKVFSNFFVKFRYLFEDRYDLPRFHTGTMIILVEALFMFIDSHILDTTEST